MPASRDVSLRDTARAIWQAGVDAVRPEPLVRQALAEPQLDAALRASRRVLVLGGGKAGTAMSAAVEAALPDLLQRMDGIVNVPAGSQRPLQRIRLHPARPAGSNQPTAAGVAGAQEMLRLAHAAGPDDVALCLLSGGGSALLPAPADGVTLADKQAVTLLLHRSGATINEMNAVRKYLSAIKGGRLAEAFQGRALFSLIISDVIGDPLDVIASGPTAPDPTTFADALAVLDRYELRSQAPRMVVRHLERGAAGELPETPKSLPPSIHNVILGNNDRALAAAADRARSLGFRVDNLGSHFQGETQELARAMAEIATRTSGPTCLLSGGETTVTLGTSHGKGGRNQEFVLACLLALPPGSRTVILSGGTDGEDGPTDAAGAIADGGTLERARQLGLDPRDYLQRHDAYHFFAATGDLLVTGLTQTNVMDVRVILVT